MKIAAVSAVFTLVTLIGTVVLVAIEHPAQWEVAGACMVAMVVAVFFGVTIEN